MSRLYTDFIFIVLFPFFKQMFFTVKVPLSTPCIGGATKMHVDRMLTASVLELFL